MSSALSFLIKLNKQIYLTLTRSIKLGTILEPFTDSGLGVLRERLSYFFHTNLFRFILTLGKQPVDEHLQQPQYV